jgi:bifunctional UDP-N-acetylglucosamine pyrophosphorylase/glucosamine-1-phosphate N-acetyltransferase
MGPMLKSPSLMPEDGATTSSRRQPRASAKDLLVVILAAGQGTRMRSAIPKILHPLAGEPLIHYPIQLARQMGAGSIVLVHAPGQEQSLAPLAAGITLVPQQRPLGTGHALNQVPQAVRGAPEVLVLYGDVPLLTAATARRLVQLRRRNELDCAVLAAVMDDPTGYGRLVESEDGRVRIVEESDATAGETEIKLVNTGVCCFRADSLWPALRRVKKSSRTGEYYLTDVFATLERRGLLASEEDEALGVNDRWQLAEAELVLRRRKNRELARSGVTIVDPATTYIDSGVSVESDAVIHPFTFLRGRTSIGARTQVGPFAEINDCRIGRDCVVGRSHLADSVVEDKVDIGPFNRLRAGAVVATGSRIGTHVEIKNTLVGPEADVHHFSYLGDAVLGKGVNIGAGTVTANFNGVVKRQTVIGDNVFIGTDSTLVAPVSIGDRAYTAAGSVITDDVPADALAIERTEQREVPKWSQRRRKTAPASDTGSRG